jgi:hypothetical protein
LAELRGLGDLSPEQRAAVLGAYAVVQGLVCKVPPCNAETYRAAQMIAVGLRSMIEASWDPCTALQEYIGLETCFHIS